MSPPMTSHLDLLPEPTRNLWLKLWVEPLLRGGILIGGTALTLRIGHRRSEDLDFAFLSEKLPTSAIALLLRKYPGWTRNDNLANYDEFLIAGQSLHDYQQDFLVNGVKVSFVALPDLARVVAPNTGNTVRIATVDELFKTKALVTAERSKSRDWFDLYILIKYHGYSVFDYYKAFESAGQLLKAENGMNRLCRGIPQLSDEGFEELMKNPPTLEEMAAFFKEQRDLYEIETAASQANSVKNTP